jgi:hypothetical protein
MGGGGEYHAEGTIWWLLDLDDPHVGCSKFHVVFLASVLFQSRDNSVITVTTLWAGRPGFHFRQGKMMDLLSSPPHPDRPWDTSSLISNWYGWSLSSGGKAAGA